MDILGRGIMPNFTMRGSRSSPFTNVADDMVNTTAAGEAMRQSISDKYSSDLSAFDQGTSALKDIFGKKEASIEDLIPEETIFDEEEPSEFSFGGAFNDYITNPILSGIDEINDTGKLAGSKISQGFDNVMDFMKFTPTTAIQAQIADAMMPYYEEEFDDLTGEGADPMGAALYLSKSGTIPGLDQELGFADGGRVNFGIGGFNDFQKVVPGGQTFSPNKLAYGYTPFMDAQQGLNYYQQFMAPTSVQQAVPVPGVPGEGEDRGFGKVELPEGFGSMGGTKDLTLGNQLGDNILKPGPGSRGPEDRMEGFRPQDNPLSFSNPANQTSMKFEDGKLVYDNVNPYLRTGVVPGDEVPLTGPLFAGLNFLGGLFSKKEKDVQDEIDAFNKQQVDALNAKKAKEQKALDEKNAKIAEDKRIADELAATKREEAARATAAEQKAKDMAAQRAARQAASTEASRKAAADKAKQNLKDRVSRFNSNPSNQRKGLGMTATGDTYSTRSFSQKQRDRNRQNNRGVGRQASKGDRGRASRGKTGGGFCFDPSTLVQMFDGSEKRIKDIKLGDKTKGGEVTGVFQFKASDEIHDYKGVTVAGSHYVKEGGKFIMVQDSPISVKIDKIPVVHSLDTTGRRIFIKDIEFADYNGDGIAKGFLANAGVDLTGFDQEVLRQVEHRLI